MKNKIATCIVVCCLLQFSELAVSAQDSWKDLKRISHGAGLQFIQNDRSCSTGKIQSLANNKIKIKTGQSTVSIDKANLLRVRGGLDNLSIHPDAPSLPLYTIYSGRSSWADLLSYKNFGLAGDPRYKLPFIVVTKDGKKHRGILYQITESAITLEEPGAKETAIAKVEIQSVDFMAVKPLSDQQEFYAQELSTFAIFDPALYPRLFNVGDRMPVRLYDAGFAEDNSPIECK